MAEPRHTIFEMITLTLSWYLTVAEGWICYGSDYARIHDELPGTSIGT